MLDEGALQSEDSYSCHISSLLAAFSHDEFDFIFIDADHGFSQVFGEFRKDFRIVVIRDSLDDGSGSLGRIAGFENAGSYEDAFCAELHHESRIGRSGHAAGSKVDDGEFLMVMDVEDKIMGTWSSLAVSYSSSGRLAAVSAICF